MSREAPGGEAPSEYFASYISTLEGVIEDCQHAFQATGNPLFVWKALAKSFEIARVKAGKQRPFPTDQAVMLPPWCMEYLSTVSARLLFVAEQGLDWRDAKRWFEETKGRDVHEWRAWRRAHRLSAEQQAALLPQMLGLVRRGWNAFAAFTSARIKAWDAAIYECFRGEGLTAAEALERMRITGDEDERALRRRLAEGRKILGRKVAPRSGPDET